MSVIFESMEGKVLTTELGGDRRRLVVQMASGDKPTVYETRYTDELIRRVLSIRTLAGLCDELARDEDRNYVERYLRYAMFGYVPRQAFAGKRLLDFGCGAGASSMILHRLLPGTEIVGVDLVEDHIEVAKARASFYGAEHMRFVVSPAPDRLPPDIGQFDFVSFSAVFEHLLPRERPLVMAQIWSILRNGGILFVNQTPHRWFPLEYHTTGLPLLNYLPQGLAHWAARRLSKRTGHEESWEMLLRRGIRGGTETDILTSIRSSPGARPIVLCPSQPGVKDRVDLWYASSMAGTRPWRSKQLLRYAFKSISRLMGEELTPTIDLAILKA